MSDYAGAPLTQQVPVPKTDYNSAEYILQIERRFYNYNILQLERIIF